MATEILKRPQMGPWRRSEKWLFLVFLVGFEDKEIFIVVELVMMFILINVFLNCVCRRLVSLERNFEVVVAVRLADDFTISAKTFETVFEAANAFCRHINTCDKIYCHDFSSFECTPAFLEYSTKKRLLDRSLLFFSRMVEYKGFKPLTSAMRMLRSISWANTPTP